jgi:predicted acylesterase/phospholipase RssA
MSGSMPPVFPSLPRLQDSIVDGAFVANVPSRVVRDMGAHFVIASNVVPPTPSRANGDRGGVTGALSRWGFSRIENAVRALYVLAWRAGADQGEIAADHTIDLAPEGSSMLEMWKGRAIVDQIRARSFSGPDALRIRDAWRRFCERRLR